MDSGKNIKHIQAEIRVPADLPKDFKVLSEAYQNAASDIFIKPELRSHVAILSARSNSGNKNDIYILFETSTRIDDEVQSFSRKFLAISKNAGLRFNADRCFVAKLPHGSKVIEHINNQAKGSNTVVSSSKTKSDVAFAEEVILEAFKQNTSDIHVESQSNGMAVIRFRINKELDIFRWITQEEAETFGTVCYTTFVGNAEDRGTAKGTYKSSSLLEGIFQRKIIDPETKQEHYIKGRMLNLAHNDEAKSDFIIRLIDKNKNNVAKRFVDMGFSKHASMLLRELETISSGAILTCGVTGSGKSTTQTNMVQHERDRSGARRKIILTEDPVEYDIELVTQITAGEKKETTTEDNDFSFTNINKKNMRADPDSLGFGEIRDPDTTKNMIKGALTGHLVYGTIHTSGAIQVFERLNEMGASMSDICREGFIRLVLFQHLLPKICPHCSVPHKMGQPIPEKYSELFVAKTMLAGKIKATSDQIAEYNELAKQTGSSLFRTLQRKGIISASDVRMLQEKKDILNESSDQGGFAHRLQYVVDKSLMRAEDINIRFRGDGCKKCKNGQIGVTPVAEVLIPDSEFLSLIRSGQKVNAKLYWRTQMGGRTAAEDSFERILTGAIDPRTVEEHLDKLDE